MAPRASSCLPHVPRLALVIGAFAMLAGCAIFEKRWPDAGTGGFGEYYVTPDPRADALGERLAGLEARDARTFAAAELDESRLLFIRIKREIAADHPEDAATNMDRLDVIVDRMERRVNRAQGNRARGGR